MSPSGEIRSPGWDGQSLYPAGVDSTLRLAVPSGCVAMLTFLAMDIVGNVKIYEGLRWDHASLTTTGSSSGNFSMSVYGHHLPEGKVYHADVVLVSFFTDWDMQRATGFRLLYSFPSLEQMPERFADGTWNCSEEGWVSIRDHFPCNLVVDCVGGEDEQDCPYSSPLCGQGEFRLGHSCYAYVTAGELSWDSASAQCQIRGGQLLSMNDVTEWRNATEMLRQYRVAARVYAGLQSASQGLPIM